MHINGLYMFLIQIKKYLRIFSTEIKVTFVSYKHQLPKSLYSEAVWQENQQGAVERVFSSHSVPLGIKSGGFKGCKRIKEQAQITGVHYLQ